MRWLGVLALVLTVIGGAAWLVREPLGFAIFRWYTTPDHAFAPDRAPPPPDYAEAESWAALPERDDPADRVPEGLSDGQDQARVAAFFVHPTTYFEAAGWNAAASDGNAGQFVDRLVLPAQASVFNGCCAVYAPRYRQATIAAFFDAGMNDDAGRGSAATGAGTGSGRHALELAYTDVERAFDEFLNRIGDRPYLLAGHSQGALHVQWLLERRVSGTRLVERLVAAWPIGYYIDAARFASAAGDVPVCDRPEQLGCVVSWNSLRPEAHVAAEAAGSICVNPLSWRADAGRVDFDANPGSLGTGRLEAAVADAQCADGRLLVSEVRSDMYDALPIYTGDGNLHVLDYSLYWLSLRRNAEVRARAWHAAHGASPG